MSGPGKLGREAWETEERLGEEGAGGLEVPDSWDLEEMTWAPKPEGGGHSVS